MKQLVLSLCIVLFTASLASTQVALAIDPNPSTGYPMAIDPGELLAHATIKNNSATAIDIGWVKLTDHLPAGWSCFVCDKNLCYTDAASMNNINKPVKLEPGEEALMDVHVRPNDISGSGYAEIQVTPHGVPGTILAKGTYNFNYSTSGVKNIDLGKLSLNPNPAKDQFTLSATTGVEKVRIFNLLGVELRSFSAKTTSQFPIYDLRPGMYLVQLVGENGKTLKTMKLHKV